MDSLLEDTLRQAFDDSIYQEPLAKKKRDECENLRYLDDAQKNLFLSYKGTDFASFFDANDACCIQGCSNVIGARTYNRRRHVLRCHLDFLRATLQAQIDSGVTINQAALAAGLNASILPASHSPEAGAGDNGIADIKPNAVWRPSSSSAVVEHKPTVAPMSAASIKKEQVDEHFLNLLLTTAAPLSLLQNPFLKKISKFEIPSTQRVRDLLYAKCMASIVETISSVKKSCVFSLSVDGALSPTKTVLITVVAHFFDPDKQVMRSRGLTIESVPSPLTPCGLRDFLDTTMTRLDLDKKKCIRIVCNGPCQMQRSLKAKFQIFDCNVDEDGIASEREEGVNSNPASVAAAVNNNLLLEKTNGFRSIEDDGDQALENPGAPAPAMCADVDAVYPESEVDTGFSQAVAEPYQLQLDDDNPFFFNRDFSCASYRLDAAVVSAVGLHDHLATVYRDLHHAIRTVQLHESLSNQLHSLCKQVPSRNVNIISFLADIQDVFPSLTQICHQNPHLCPKLIQYKDTLTELWLVLKPIREFQLKLQGTEQVTVSLIKPGLQRLKANIKSRKLADFVETLKLEVDKKFDDVLVRQEFFDVASYLDPRTRQFVSDNHDAVIDTVRLLDLEMPSSSGNNGVASAASSDSKQDAKQLFGFVDYEREAISEDAALRAELEYYSGYQLDYDEPVNFWNSPFTMIGLPRLSKVAMGLLSMPTTATAATNLLELVWKYTESNPGDEKLEITSLKALIAYNCKISIAK